MKPITNTPALAGLARLSPAVRGLRFSIAGRQSPLTVRAATIHIGRADAQAGFFPELDLTPFDGLERGVSRHHALIRWTGEEGFVLVDQQSSNGTWLEEVRLEPGRPYPLPVPTTIRFGDLLVQLTTAD
jgi:pSer/pThr/pTyr-binding forkhead associated (FHA) protein